MVIETQLFRESQARLPEQVRRATRRKIALLCNNRQHPSLRVHRMNHLPGVWSAAITHRHRILYQVAGETLHLLDVVGHRDIDRI